MNKASIDLENHRTKGSKVFTGRERGISVRENTKIDVLVSENKQVEIIIPTDIMSINPSFLEEFLTDKRLSCLWLMIQIISLFALQSNQVFSF